MDFSEEAKARARAASLTPAGLAAHLNERSEHNTQHAVNYQSFVQRPKDLKGLSWAKLKASA